MDQKVTGEFEVKMLPQPASDGDGGAARLLLDKRYHGALSGTGCGQMLALVTPTHGSAGYVAMERVTGTLQGRTGSFALQHSGSMDRGAAALVVQVIADSGTEGLSGLRGRMAIRIEGGKHFYDFTYSLDV